MSNRYLSSGIYQLSLSRFRTLKVVFNSKSMNEAAKLTFPVFCYFGHSPQFRQILGAKLKHVVAGIEAMHQFVFINRMFKYQLLVPTSVECSLNSIQSSNLRLKLPLT